MKKIPTIFKRNPKNMAELLMEENTLCDWVFRGEGVATQKYDGTCCLVRDGRLYKRREIKKGKTAPVDFEQADHDPVTGKTVGWVPVMDGKEDKWHREAYMEGISDGTYELCGPKVQGNPERMNGHFLVSHSHAEVFEDAPRDFSGLCDFLVSKDIEGLVFHHPDGRMAKIKKRDFQLKRKQ